jgi:hypothetical protein
MEIDFLKTIVTLLRHRWDQARRAPADAGYTTETVIVTALLVGLAITVLAVLAAKVKHKANVLDRDNHMIPPQRAPDQATDHAADLDRADAGAATAETAVAMPLLLGLVLLVVQFGVWAHTTHVAYAAATEALAAARLENGSVADGQQRANQVRAQIGQSLLSDTTITVTRNADTAQVDISGTAPRVIPLPFLTFPIHATVSGPVERFRAETAQQR